MVSENRLKAVDLTLDDGANLGELSGDLRTCSEISISNGASVLDDELTVLGKLNVHAIPLTDSDDLVDEDVDGDLPVLHRITPGEARQAALRPSLRRETLRELPASRERAPLRPS